MKIILRPDQQQVKNDIYIEWSKGHRNIVAVMPTGSGKSILVSDIILDGYGQNLAQAVIAHRNELVSQMSIHIANRGIPHRIIGANETVSQITRLHRETFNGRSFINPSAKTAVVGVDTLIARRETLADWAAQIDRWVVDEQHHLLRPPNKWGKAVEMFTNAHGLGVTATPERPDGQGLGAHADGVAHSMVQGLSMRELINIGALCDYEIVCPTSDIEVNDDDVTAGGDYSPKKLKAAAKGSHIVGDVVKAYQRYASGKQAICFATDVETSGKIAAQFNEAGIRAASLSAETPSAVREKYNKEFISGKLLILVNVDLFDEGYDCLDTETEILTPNGWKNHIEISGETQCYAWDSEKGDVKIVPILDKAFRNTRGDESFINFKSQHIDVRVTENHRIYYRKHNHLLPEGMNTKVFVKTAGEMEKNQRAFNMPLSAEYDFPGIDLKDDELRILGWYLTDGWITRGRSLSIAQSKEKGLIKIKEILKNLGWDYTYRVRLPTHTCYANAKPCVEFRIPSGTAHGSMKRNGWGHIAEYFIKDINPKLHLMTRRQFSIFWESLMDGDGDKRGNRSGTLTCARKTQVDAYMQMAVLRGFAVMHGEYYTKKGVKIYSLRVRDEKWLRMRPKDSRSVKITKEKSENELVWCVTNELDTLITRRKGKVIILGNCPKCEVVIMARPTASIVKYLQQFGRAMRTAPGKSHGLIIDHVSNVKRHGYPDKPRFWTLDRRDKRAKKQLDPDEIPLTECKTCARPYERFLAACPHCGATQPLPEPHLRSVEMVDGDLILLDRETLEKMRQAAILEAPGDMGARVGHVAGDFAARGVMARQVEKIAAQERLKHSLAQWAACERLKGHSDSEIHRKFYLTTGIDVLSALGLDNRQKYEELATRVEGWYL